MELDPREYTDAAVNQSSLLSSFVVGGLVAIATVATRKGAERSWGALFKRPPPNRRAPDDADLMDAMLWAVVIGATTGLVRLGVRRTLRSKTKR